MKKIIGLAICLGCALAMSGCTERTVTAPGGLVAKGSEKTSFDQYVVLGEYKGIQIDQIEITQEDLQSEIGRTLQDNASVSQVTDRPAELGDMVNIDYQGTQNGEAFENGTFQNQFLELGSGTFIPGFEEGLVGVMPGTQVVIPVTFPEDYWDADMAGSEAEFTVTLNYIEQMDSVPEYTDELVVELTGGELKTTEEYTEWLRKQMELDALNYRRGQLMSAILATCQFQSVPQDRLDAMTAEITEYYTNMAQDYYGETLEEYAVNSGLTLEELNDRFAIQADDNVRQAIVALAIAEREGIQVTDIECEESAKAYGYDGFSELAGIYGEQRAREVILMDKVVDYLLDESD